MVRRVSLWTLSALFISAGCLHLLRPRPFLEIMPPGVPKPDWMVAGSGVAEILGGLGLLVPRMRAGAKWGLVLLLICVFPANIYMAVSGVAPGGLRLPVWLVWSRLGLQPLLIWWVNEASSRW